MSSEKVEPLELTTAKVLRRVARLTVSVSLTATTCVSLAFACKNAMKAELQHKPLFICSTTIVS